MLQRFTILAASLCQFSNLVPAAASPGNIFVSGYQVPQYERNAIEEGYERENYNYAALALGTTATANGYTNGAAPPGELCRAFTQPDTPQLYMIAIYEDQEGCKTFYKKLLK